MENRAGAVNQRKAGLVAGMSAVVRAQRHDAGRYHALRAAAHGHHAVRREEAREKARAAAAILRARRRPRVAAVTVAREKESHAGRGESGSHCWG